MGYRGNSGQQFDDFSAGDLGGVATVTGSAALISSSSLSVGAVVTKLATVALTSSSSLVATGTTSSNAVIAAYGFETSGAVGLDSTGNGHTGTLVGDAVWSSPGHNSSGTFYNPGSAANGSGMTVPRAGMEPTDALTIMGWVQQLDTANNYKTLVANRGPVTLIPMQSTPTFLKQTSQPSPLLPPMEYLLLVMELRYLQMLLGITLVVRTMV